MTYKGRYGLRKKLKRLEELQELDLRVDGLASVRDELVSRGEALRMQVEEGRSLLEAKRGDMGSVEEERGQLEVNSDLERENITRSEARLREIKTQKEYQAVQREISAAKKLLTEFEEQSLHLMSRLEEMSTLLESETAALLALEGEAGASVAEVNEELERISRAIELEHVTREKLVAEIPANLLRRYGLLREQRRGIAVVEARDGSCLGCNLQIPPQMYNLLFRGEEIQTCPHCQRLLVLKLVEE
jgi:predicted  nucleic acid-binding Zn-ribbon protein